MSGLPSLICFLPDSTLALDRMIDDFGELIRGHYHVAELGDPSTSTDVRYSDSRR